MIRVYDGEPDCQFNLEVPPETPQGGGFHVSPQVLQHGFPVTVSTPANDPTCCWRETIPLSDLWKSCSPEYSATARESIRFYQPSQALTVHADPTPPFDNSSSHQPIQFTMTCPIPHCCYQCQTVVEIWRHITWTHVLPQPEEGIEGIVEKVVLENA